MTKEIIKCSDRNMIEHLQTLFNNIMESGYYHIYWNHGLICSIYKLSKKDDPNNYRGITLPNCLGKQSYIRGYKMNFKKILFYPLPKLVFEKITEFLITPSHYSV